MKFDFSYLGTPDVDFVLDGDAGLVPTLSIRACTTKALEASPVIRDALSEQGHAHDLGRGLTIFYVPPGLDPYQVFERIALEIERNGFTVRRVLKAKELQSFVLA